MQSSNPDPDPKNRMPAIGPADETLIPEDTRPPERDPAGSDAGSTGRPARPILVVVAIFSETAEESRDSGERHTSEQGCCYPLRAGDVLYVGKPPGARKIERPDGTKTRVTYTHLFPLTRGHAYVSRRHLAIEVMKDGSFSLYDFSTNGVYLEQEGKHLRRSADGRITSYRITRRETVVLGIDLSHQRDKRMMEQADRHRLQLVPLESTDPLDPEATRSEV